MVQKKSNNLTLEKIRCILIGILLFFVYSLCYFNIPITAGKDIIIVLGIFSLIQLAYIFWSWHKLTENVFDAYVLFIVACYAFNLAQPILEVFNATAESKSILTHYKIEVSVYSEATYLSLCFILAFHFGAIISISSKQLFKRRLIPQLAYKAIYKVALILAIVSFPGYFYNLIINLIMTATYGYDGAYMEGTGKNTFLKLIGYFYTPSLISIYFVKEATKKPKASIIIILILTTFLPPLFIGGRSTAVILLGVLFIIYLAFHKIKLKQMAIVALIGYFFLQMLTIIADTRHSTDKSLSTLSDNKKDNENAALTTLSEMGASIQPLIFCLKIIPDHQDFRYGESYMYSLTTVIPNLGFWDVHPAKKHANLGEWLMDYLELTYGPGFSIVAEAYYNFGYFGFLMMTFLGFIFAKIFISTNEKTLMYNPIKYILSVIFLWFTIRMVRNSFEFAVRAMVYYYLPMYWLMSRTYKTICRRYRKEDKLRVITNQNCRSNKAV